MKVKIAFPRARKYSEAFKRHVVGEYERGGVTRDALMEKYHIGGHSAVLLWCRKYGRLSYPTTGVPGRPMKDPQKNKIRMLEHELKEAKEKLRVYEKLIEVTNRELGIDIQKKSLPSCPGTGSRRHGKRPGKLPTSWFQQTSVL